MFLASHTNFTERARAYASITEVGADFGSESSVYAAASQFFGQDLVPQQIVIGRRAVDSVDVAVNDTSGTITNSYNGTEVVTDVSGAADATAAVGLIESDFTAASITGIDFTDNLDGTYSISPTVAGEDYSFSTEGTAQTLTYNSSETWVDALDEVSLYNTEWYAFTAETHDPVDVAYLAAAVEARKIVYGTSTSSTDVLSAASTDDIGQQLYDLGYDRTFVMYHPDADTAYPEAAWIGGQLPEQPGSNTWKFKSLSGVAVTPLSATQSNAAKDKKVNTYERVGGVGITSEGVMASGEFIDTIVFLDWLEARMREGIFFRLVNTKKIPFTAQGTTVIEAEIRRVLSEGIANGGLAPNPQPIVNVPNVLSLDPNLRATRTLEGITFEARLAGAVHYVKVRGVVNV